MTRLRRIVCGAALTLAALGALGGGTALAAPAWNLGIHHAQSNFPPGGTAEYWFALENVGSSATSGPITLSVDLPTGITRDMVIENIDPPYAGASDSFWSCPGSPGDSTVSCTSTTFSLPRHSVYRGLRLSVDIAPDAAGEPVASATLQGGGAPEVSALEPARISPEPAPFGVVPGSFEPGFFEADGLTAVSDAGAHPDLVTFPFDFTTVPAGTAVEQQVVNAESVRELHVDTPPGFLGNPTAVGECSPAEFAHLNCPASSQVGRIDLLVYPVVSQFKSVFHQFHLAVFNVAHPRGWASNLAFSLGGNAVNIRVALNPANRYAITSEVPNINETIPVFDQKLTLWGVPADSSHDSERCLDFTGNPGGNTSEECSTDAPRKPFLTLPSQCEADNVFRLFDYDSWQHPGLYGPDVTHTLPSKMSGCEALRFEPDVSLEPTGRQANTPTGLDVRIHVPQNENPDALATPPIKSTVVTLPEGMTVNPGFADGLAGCSEAQIGISHDGTPNGDPVACPDNSRIGEVEVSTPLLPKPIEGSMFLARQEANPFGSLLAVYLALHDTEQRGILVKVPLELSLDPVSGRITTTAEDLPQFPFEDLTLKFRSGDRAPLVNPPECGQHTIDATMTSYARPGVAIDASNSFQVSEGPGGGACQNVASQRPFDPRLVAGTLNPVAGAFSPLNLRAFRTDADQELSTAEGTAPAGLVASLHGVGRCTEAQIAAAVARSRPGQGAQEMADPSCPANSQVGTVEAGAGAGPSPIYVPGKVYLAGPYRGAPLSGVAIVPAVAGPTDLGNVVVRSPAYVDPKTAQVSIETDPLPQIVHGVLIRTRDVRIHLDRPDFAVNPTSCAEKSIEATLHSTEGAVKDLSNRFQVGDCASLGFKPKLAIKLKGGTKRGAHPALKAVVTPRAGDANFASAVVTLPRSAFLDQAHIRTICTRVQFAAGAGNGAECPAGAVYGRAKAWTPLLDEPLEGPALLRSSDNNLPDLVVALHGPPSTPIEVELASRIDSKRGGIRSSFEAIPDVPVSRFILEMQGGKKGLIVNSVNLCSKPKGNRAKVDLSGQNGLHHRFHPPLKPQCGGKGHAAERPK